MTSCAVEEEVYPDQNVANIIPSFRLRSYSNSRVTDWSVNCHITYHVLRVFKTYRWELFYI
jgi:hypothetical protein